MEMKRYICIAPSFFRSRHWQRGDYFASDLKINNPNFRLLRDDESAPIGRTVFIEKTPEELEQERITLATERPLPGSAPRRPSWNPSDGTGTKLDYDVLNRGLK